MDVVTFDFKKLPAHTVNQIKSQLRKIHAYTKSTPVERWFTDFSDKVVITRIYGEIYAYGESLPPTMCITDYRITMPKDKYMEFCLRWL